MNYPARRAAVQAGGRSTFETYIKAAEVPVITTEMLQSYYKEKSVVSIDGDGYSILLDGASIINPHNELMTDIRLTREAGRTEFELNGSENLCGPVTVGIDGITGRYLYLYNESTGRYQKLEAADMKNLVLTSGGRYLVSDSPVKERNRFVIIIIICGVILAAAGTAAYIGITKKYWFW